VTNLRRLTQCAVAAGALAACAVGLSAGDRADRVPTEVDFDIARVEWVHSQLGPEGTVHCNRFERLRCRRIDQQIFQCTYREWSRTQRLST
jgi:hypothetical protein